MVHNKIFLKSFFVIYCLTLFFMGKTCLASSSELNYRDDPASELNEYTLKAVFDYYIPIQNTFGHIYGNFLNNQVTNFYNNVDWNSFLNLIHDTFKDTDVECQNLVFALENSSANSTTSPSYFYLSIFANNNTTGNLPFTRFYLSGNGWLYNQVQAKQFDVILNDDGTTTHQDLNSFIGAYFRCTTSGGINKYSLFDHKEDLTNSSKKIVQVAGTQTADFGGILALSPTASFYTITSDNTSTYQWLMPTNYINLPSSTEIPDIPDEPSGDEGGGTTGGNTGNITNPSGDTTGKVDLSGIESGIGNINQNIDKTNEKLDGISGELGNLNNSMNDLNNNLTTVPTLSGENITSSEITDALDFEFAEDPYANFWLQLTTGLSGALTNNVRSIDIEFRNKTYKISLDDFSLQLPAILKTFLSLTSTVFIFWKMAKYIKIIVNNITSGNMDEVLQMNEEEGIIDLF